MRGDNETKKKKVSREKESDIDEKVREREIEREGERESRCIENVKKRVDRKEIEKEEGGAS